jgi:hypothetical protein
MSPGVYSGFRNLFWTPVIAAEREKTEEAVRLLFGDPPTAFISQSNLPVTKMDQPQ